jgi:PAS domain S-box-containing protein
MNLSGINPITASLSLNDMTNKEKDFFSSRRLEKIEGGLYELSTRKFSKTICKAIEDMLGIKEIYVMGFVINNEFHGGVKLLSKSIGFIKNKSTIETIINQASIIIQRKLIEESLRNSQEKYKQVIEFANEAILVIQDYRAVLANPQLCKQTGYTLEEIYKMSIEDIVVKDDLDKLRNIYKKRTLGEDAPQIYVFRYITKTGEIRCFEAKSTTITWEGKPASLIFGFDITERLKIEDEMNHRLKIEELVKNISNHFLKISFDDFEAEIERDLAILGEFAGVDHCVFTLFSEQNDTIATHLEWIKTGLIPNHEKIIGQKLDKFEWSLKKLKEDNYLYLPKISDIPDEGIYEKKAWTAIGFKSLLSFPLNLDKKIIGYFGFVNETCEKEWSNNDIILLQLISDVFSNVLKRRQCETLFMKKRVFKF